MSFLKDSWDFCESPVRKVIYPTPTDSFFVAQAKLCKPNDLANSHLTFLSEWVTTFDYVTSLKDVTTRVERAKENECDNNLNAWNGISIIGNK